MAAFGLRAEWADSDEEQAAPLDHDTPLHLWPENWPVWCLWRDVETQWRADHVGLDYGVVRLIIAERFRRKDRKTVFWLVQGMEEATLDEWRLRDKRQAQK